MQVIVCFGKEKVAVPCDDGNFNVEELMRRAIISYRHAAGRPDDYGIFILRIGSPATGVFLNKDDVVSDVIGDQEELVAVYEEDDKSLGMVLPISSSDDKEKLKTDFYRFGRLAVFCLSISVVAIIVIVVALRSKTEPSDLEVVCSSDDPKGVSTIFQCYQIANCKPFKHDLCTETCAFGFEVDDNNCQISCECAERGVFEGDIAFEEEDLPRLLVEYGHVVQTGLTLFTSSATRKTIWLGNVINERHIIPYAIDETFAAGGDETLLMRAINEISSRTCIGFVERTDEEDYLSFESGQKKCETKIGKVGGKQQVMLGDDCVYFATYLHEISHALGFFHEHVRPDRDSTIDIKFDNIVSTEVYNFAKQAQGAVAELGTPYDIESVLQWDGDAHGDFKNQVRQKTIFVRDTGDPVVHDFNAGLSQWDIQDIKRLYRCGTIKQTEETTKVWALWDMWSECSNQCGQGFQYRFRFKKATTGDNVEFDNGRRNCVGLNCGGTNYTAGIWGEWSEFGACQQKCGTGASQVRTRKCLTEICDGDKAQSVLCGYPACAQPSQWEEWGGWTACSRTCKRRKFRQRVCETNTVPKRAIVGCKGASVEFAFCAQLNEFCEAPAMHPEREANTDEEMEMGLFRVQSKSIASVLCDGNTKPQWMFRDMNGDGNVDGVCKNEFGRVKVSWTFKTGITTLSGNTKIKKCERGRAYLGDFDGDGQADLLCESAGGVHSIVFTFRGKLQPTPFLTAEVCAGGDVVIVDRNGDKRDDVMCVYRNTKTVMESIYYP